MRSCDNSYVLLKCFQYEKTRHTIRNYSESKPLCFNCGESGHFYANCPKAKTEVPRNVRRNDRGGLQDVKKNKERCMRTRAQAFQMTTKEARDKHDVVSGTFTLKSLPICAIFDSDATFSLMSIRFAEKIKIPLGPLDVNVIVEMIDESQILVTREYLDCRLELMRTLTLSI